MEPSEQDRALRDKWRANEAELQRLRDLPTGAVDPAERERQIDAEQDDIEGQIGEEYLRKRSLVPPTDPRHWEGKDLGDETGQMMLNALTGYMADRVGVSISVPDFIAALYRVRKTLGKNLDLGDEAVLKAIEDELRP